MIAPALMSECGLGKSTILNYMYMSSLQTFSRLTQMHSHQIRPDIKFVPPKQCKRADQAMDHADMITLFDG
jgi:hypothetical protein